MTEHSQFSAVVEGRIADGMVNIVGMEVQRVTHKGHPVITFAMVDIVHQRPDGTAKRNFGDNRDRFIEGEDFTIVAADQKDEFRTFGIEVPNRGLTFLTQRGYLKLTKPMNDDRAWRVQGEMIDRYFAVEAARSMTPAEIILQQAQMLVEVERKQAALYAAQADQAKRIATTERRLDQIETATDHFTCIGYARWVKQTTIDLQVAADLGRRASKRCRELGIPVSKIPDPRFGAVNQFPRAILDEAWEKKFGIAAVH